MAALGYRSGVDILNVFFQYDQKVDTMYVGIDCDGICGDVDGDGDPGNSFNKSYAVDYADMDR